MNLYQRVALYLSMVVLASVTLATHAGAPGAAVTTPPAPPPAPPLRVGLSLGPKTLAPALAADSTGARILQLTHPALLRYNSSYKPMGQVASGCSQPLPTQVVCTLPTGKTFTSGAPLTAPAVAAWLKQVQANPRSPLSGALRNISITTFSHLAPAATTLTFTLPSPTLSFMGTLTEIPLADPAANNHGAGPYVAAQDEATSIVTLRPVHGSPLPPLQFIPLADPTTRLLKLQKDELDVLVNDLPPTLVNYAQAQAAARGWQVLTLPSSSYSYVALNFNNPLLAQSSVREALSLSLNRPLLRKALLNNLARPASSLLPPGHPSAWGAREDPYDLMTAEGLLDDTQMADGRTLIPGPDGVRLSLTLLTSTEAFTQRLAQALQAQWQALGVDVRLRSAEWGSFFTSVQAGQFDMALLTWTGEQQPSFYHQLFNSGMVPPHGFNRGHVNDSIIDELTAQLVAAPDVVAQTNLALAVQQRVAQVRPYLPLWRRDHVLVLGAGVTGCTLSVAGDYRGLTQCRKNIAKQITR